MADDISVTPGSGATIAADDIGGGKLAQRVKPVLGADGTGVDAIGGAGATTTGTQRVVLANDQTWGTTKVSANFTRPANTTVYAAGDIISATTSTSPDLGPALSFSMPVGSGVIRRVRIRKSDQTVVSPTITLWLYEATLVPTVGDNSAFTSPMQDCIGSVDVDVTTGGTDDAVGWEACDIPFSGSTIYAQLETQTAFSPATGEVFTVDLWYLAG